MFGFFVLRFFILIFELRFFDIVGKTYLSGEIGIRARLKILWTVMSVRVQVPPQVQCNDSEMNDGTDAMYEMETFETRIKV